MKAKMWLETSEEFKEVKHLSETVPNIHLSL